MELPERDLEQMRAFINGRIPTETLELYRSHLIGHHRVSQGPIMSRPNGYELLLSICAISGAIVEKEVKRSDWATVPSGTWVSVSDAFDFKRIVSEGRFVEEVFKPGSPQHGNLLVDVDGQAEMRKQFAPERVRIGGNEPAQLVAPKELEDFAPNLQAMGNEPSEIQVDEHSGPEFVTTTDKWENATKGDPVNIEMEDGTTKEGFFYRVQKTNPNILHVQLPGQSGQKYTKFSRAQVYPATQLVEA